MSRVSALHEITCLFGDVLKGFEAAGTPLDDRSIQLFVDAFCDRYKALPEQPALPFLSLIKSVRSDEINHGGLLSRDTLHLANRLKLEIDKR